MQNCNGKRVIKHFAKLGSRSSLLCLSGYMRTALAITCNWQEGRRERVDGPTNLKQSRRICLPALVFRTSGSIYSYLVGLTLLVAASNESRPTLLCLAD